MIEYLLQLFLIGIGTARLTALVSRDSILHPLRDCLFTFFPPENNQRLGWDYQNMIKATKRERESFMTSGNWYQRRFLITDEPEREAHWLGELIGCPFCISVWIAVAQMIFWYQNASASIVLNSLLFVAYIGAVGVKKGGWA